jgi:inhibitor of cysteine peptidase
MLKNFSIVVMLFLSLGLIANCGGSSSSEERAEVKVYLEDSGKQINLYRGQILVVSLEAQTSTGYTWEIAELDDLILKQEGEPEFQPSSGAIGAPGMQIFRFESIGSGDTDLKLIYHQPWMENVEPAKTFSVHVTVL